MNLICSCWVCGLGVCREIKEFPSIGFDYFLCILVFFFQQSHSPSSASKDGCCFSEVGCAFRVSETGMFHPALDIPFGEVSLRTESAPLSQVMELHLHLAASPSPRELRDRWVWPQASCGGQGGCIDSFVSCREAKRR